jgi:hypothetical protein
MLFFSSYQSISSGSTNFMKTNEIQSNNVSYLIITTNSLSDNVKPLAIWKTQKGLFSRIITIEDIELEYSGFDTAEKIRNCIKQYYTEFNTKWVVLAGGENHVPSRAVSIDGKIIYCDYYYSNLDDNWLLDTNGVASLVDIFDWEAEVYVGRLPADKASQMNKLVRRIIEYEKTPPIGAWMKHALFAGTFACFKTDVNGNNIFDDDDYIEFDTNRNHNWLKENVLPGHWTSTLLAEREGIAVTSYPYDGNTETSTFINEVNNGASIVMADAHGGPFGMARSIFTNDVDNDSLFDYGVDEITSEAFLTTSSNFNTNGKNGFYWLAACSTGTFTAGDCLSEYLVRNCGIGCIASYESSYYDPFWYNGSHLGWYTQGISTRFWEQLLMHGFNQPGKAFALAKEDYVVDNNVLSGLDTNGRTLTQYNLMGDPEVNIWTDIPVAIQPEIELDNITGVVKVRALAGEQPLANVTVTLTSVSYFYNVTTNELGEATLSLPEFIKPEDVTITLTKNQYLPYQELLLLSDNPSFYIMYSVFIPFTTTFVIVLVFTIYSKRRISEKSSS